MRFSLKPIVLTLLCVFAHSACAGESRALIKPVQSADEPVLIEADNLTGETKEQIIATGNAILLKTDQTLRADRLLYDQVTGDTEVFGKVVIDQDGNLLSQQTDGQNNAGLDPSQLRYVRELEAGYNKRIEAILSPIVGVGNVHAQVAADIVKE